jgi:hypothetical protein
MEVALTKQRGKRLAGIGDHRKQAVQTRNDVSSEVEGKWIGGLSRVESWM